tara:strand:- start:434 stop:673 length:240 start_codon:yes stop_codon:yes gene_type:complete
MQDILLLALIISVLFVIFKFLDVRFIQKNNKSQPKQIARDALFSFISSGIGLFLVEYFGLLSSSVANKPTAAFLDDPNF